MTAAEAPSTPSLRKPKSAQLSTPRQKKPGKTGIIVTGMHRSGTSALTRLLNLLGCDVSSGLVPADEFNARGYWESQSIFQLNDQMLASAGLEWNSWEPLNPDWMNSPKRDEFQDRAANLLSGDFGSSHLFVIKDPRICRMLPVWSGAVEMLGATPLVVAPVRSPIEVASSLLKRNHMNPSLAQLLWLRHVLDAEFDSRSLKRVFVRYDDALSDWRSVADRISRELGGLAFPRRSVAAEIEIDAFISPSLKNHEVSKESVTRDFSPWVSQTYDILARWSADKSATGDFNLLDNIREAYDRASANFANPVIEHQQHGIYLASRLDSMGHELSSLVSEKETSQGQQAELKLLLEDAESKLSVQTGTLQARLLELEALRREIDSRNIALADYDRDVLSARSQVEIAENALAASRAEMFLLTAEIDALRLKIDAGEQEIAALQTELATVTSQYTTSLESLERVNDAWMKSKAESDKGATEGERLKQELAAALAALEASETARANLQGELVEKDLVLKDKEALEEELATAITGLEKSAKDYITLKEELQERDQGLADVKAELAATVREAARDEIIRREAANSLRVLNDEAYYAQTLIAELSEKTSYLESLVATKNQLLIEKDTLIVSTDAELHRLKAIEISTTWQATRIMRKVLTKTPLLKATLRRLASFIYRLRHRRSD